jgi:hypothetical protein
MLQGAEKQGWTKSMVKIEVWAQIDTLPAKCSTECPQENYFRILEIFLVG